MHQNVNAINGDGCRCILIQGVHVWDADTLKKMMISHEND